MTSHKISRQAVNKLYLVLERNNLLDTELRNYIWDLEDYITICESEEEKNIWLDAIKKEVKDFTKTVNELIDML